MPCLHVYGCSDLVRARSRLLCDGLATEADRFLFIDADTAASPEDIVRLAEHEKLKPESAVTGGYLTADGKIAAVPTQPVDVDVGGDTRYVELLVAGMGFAAVERRTIETLNTSMAPVRDKTGETWRPYFLPFVLEYELPDGTKAREYVPEDYAFWWRVRTMASCTLWLDTHLPVGHVKESVLMPRGRMDFGLSEVR